MVDCALGRGVLGNRCWCCCGVPCCGALPRWGCCPVVLVVGWSGVWSGVAGGSATCPTQPGYMQIAVPGVSDADRKVLRMPLI